MTDLSPLSLIIRIAFDISVVFDQGAMIVDTVPISPVWDSDWREQNGSKI